MGIGTQLIFKNTYVDLWAFFIVINRIDVEFKFLYKTNSFYFDPGFVAFKHRTIEIMKFWNSCKQKCI